MVLRSTFTTLIISCRPFRLYDDNSTTIIYPCNPLIILGCAAPRQRAGVSRLSHETHRSRQAGGSSFCTVALASCSSYSWNVKKEEAVSSSRAGGESVAAARANFWIFSFVELLCYFRMGNVWSDFLLVSNGRCSKVSITADKFQQQQVALETNLVYVVFLN